MVRKLQTYSNNKLKFFVLAYVQNWKALHMYIAQPVHKKRVQLMYQSCDLVCGKQVFPSNVNCERFYLPLRNSSAQYRVQH